MASAAVCELAYTSNAYANNLKDVTVVISGTLRIPEFRNGKWCIHEITRDEMDAFITEFGGVMTTSVSRKTTCLISDDPHSNNAKVRKAKELGTPILFLNVFLSEYFPEGIPE